MTEERIREDRQGGKSLNILAPGGGNRPIRLKEIAGTEDARFSTGIGELDRVLGGGIVLKFNASQRYCTDGVSAALFRKVCAGAEVPVQTYCNRADIPGGSTLGRISLGKVSVLTADIGLPQLAMHSSYETAAVADASALEDAMESFYGAYLEATESGFRVL